MFHKSFVSLAPLVCIISTSAYAQNAASPNLPTSLRREAGGHIELQALRYTYGLTNFERTKSADGSSSSYKFKNSLLLSYTPRVSFLGHAKGYVFGLAGDMNRPGEGHLNFGFEVMPGLDVGMGATIALQTFDDLQSQFTTSSGAISPETERTSNQIKLIGGPYVRSTTNLDFALLEVQGEVEYGVIKDEVKLKDQESQKTSDTSVFVLNLETALVFPLGRNFTYVTGINVNYQSLKNKKPLNVTYSEIKRSDLAIGFQLANFRYKF